MEPPGIIQTNNLLKKSILYRENFIMKKRANPNREVLRRMSAEGCGALKKSAISTF